MGKTAGGEATPEQLAAKRPSFLEACRRYVHRFTRDHVPEWASKPAPNGKYYAPQFRSDLEWYDNTQFYPHPMADRTHCFTAGQTWPFGQWLDRSYKAKERNQQWQRT